MTCPRLYFWEHVIKMKRTKDDGARRFGTMYHKGLEAWWTAMDGGDVPWRDKDSALVAALQGIADNARHIDTDPYDVAKAEAMMIAYHARYFELEFQSVHAGGGAEMWFNMPLRDGNGTEVPGWRVTGRKDVVKLFPDGRVKPVESKTTSSKIGLGDDYWARLAVDMQVSIYIDEAQRSGFATEEALYDVSRKPGVEPRKATPTENQRMTKGKGCSSCGGRGGGKLGVAQGTGKVMAAAIEGGKQLTVEVDCTVCGGSGWKEAPALHKGTRLDDEPPAEFKVRVAEEIAEDPNAYFRQCIIKRTPDQLAESRDNLVVTTGIIGSLTSLAQATGALESQKAKRCFAQNTGACTSIFGRSCDFLPVCSGQVNPFDSHLYTIGRRS